jgi:hypothetical protein
MSEPATFLPYHCPRMRGDYLQSPCAGQVAEARARRQKFPQALLGPQEHCLTCQGKDLVIREGAAPAGTVKEYLTVPEVPPVQAAGGSIGQPVVDQLVRTAGRDACATAAGAVSRPLGDESMSKGTLSVSEAEKLFGKERMAEIMADPDIPRVAPPVKGQFCKHHPTVESHKNKNGAYMGLCRECLAIRAADNSRNRGKPVVQEKMTPAVARDLRMVKEAMAAATKPGFQSPDIIGDSAPGVTPHPDVQSISLSGALPMCAKHNLPVKYNCLGVSMGGCQECRREIAAMGGCKARIQAAIDPLERLFADFTEELAWLRAQAESQIREPEKQLVFLVRQAMDTDG